MAGKIVAYGGHFGNTLITKEYFLKTWQGHLSQLTRIADTSEELTQIDELTLPMREMVAAKAERYITEAEAVAQNLPAYRKG